MGAGRYKLLKNIKKTNSLKKSAASLGISYKTAYNYINRIEKRLGKKIVDSAKGGITHGSTELNKTGAMLLRKYEQAVRKMK